VAKLVIYEEIKGQETVFEDFEFLVNRILIGSAPENHLVLDSPDIAAVHASLELRHEDWVLQDLGGATGTQVNQNLIDGPYRLQHGDFIELGHIKMKFEDQGEAEVEEEEEFSPETTMPQEGASISGGVWLATLAGGTLAFIFIILFLLIVADILGVIKINDLLPWLK
jgi:predicted component of type VI protein secretion system